MKNKLIERGLEPDECFYVQSASRIGNKRDLDFAGDPPPDLFIEIEVSRRLSNRVGICAALQIPEVWLYGENGLRILNIGKTGKYKPVNSSLCFPDLSIKELNRFLIMCSTNSSFRAEHETMRAFQAWIRDTKRKS